MYENGDLHLGLNKDEDEDGCWISEKVRGLFYLDHSCDEWVIGDKAHVKLLIEDLQKILKETS